MELKLSKRREQDDVVKSSGERVFCGGDDRVARMTGLEESDFSLAFSRVMEKGTTGNEPIHYSDNGDATGVVERERDSVTSPR